MSKQKKKYVQYREKKKSHEAYNREDYENLKEVCFSVKIQENSLYGFKHRVTRGL